MQWMFWLLAVILAAAAGYWVYRADARRAVPYPWITSVLRSLVVFFTLLLVLMPTINITKHVVEKPIVLLLQDNSRSIANALGPDSNTYRKTMESLMNRLSADYKVVQWGFGGQVQPDSPYLYRQQATDISAALQRAQEFYGVQNLGAVVLATDGRFNQGVNPLYQQLSLHSPLYAVAIGDSTRQKDLRISAAYANKTVTLNSSFEVRADIVAELCRGYNNSVAIKEGDETLGTVPLAVNADKYDRSVSFTIKAGKAGLHHYVITAPDAGDEKNLANNRRDIFVEVAGEKKSILIISAAPHPDVNALKEALSGLESYKVTVLPAEPFPSLEPYNVVIVHGLPAVHSRVAAQLLQAHKPIWFVVSTQTDITALNTLGQLTHTAFTQSNIHDAQGAYNPSFNAFLLPQNIQSVTDKMPPLVSNVGGIIPAPGASVLFSQKAWDGEKLPLWLMQQGAMPTAVLAGEGIWRWRLYEYKNFNGHSVVDECIRQTVAFLSANGREKPFTVALPRYVWSDQEAISLGAYLLNANNEQVNTPDVKLTITDSAGRKQDFSFERSGSAYNLNVGIWAGGTYSYTAHTSYNGRDYTASGSFAVESMPLELMQTGADYPLLYGLAKKYNGAFFTARNMAPLYDSITRNEHVKPLIKSNTESVPLVDRKWYFFIILALATAEWLLRKYWLAQ
jgi:hypothetical protein